MGEWYFFFFFLLLCAVPLAFLSSYHTLCASLCSRCFRRKSFRSETAGTPMIRRGCSQEWNSRSQEMQYLSLLFHPLKFPIRNTSREPPC